jgi:1-acyl-sn-glycerol-3-phosphate acyltransferase
MSLLDTAYCIQQTLAISIPTVLDAMTGRLTVERCDARLHSWSRRLLARAEVKLSVEADAPVDWSRAYVIMSNHQSLFDIPVLFACVPGTMRMITKKELFAVPIWGRAMREAGMISIDRGNRESAFASLRSAKEVLQRGVHIWIAPEGTRTRSGRLGTLKKGGFVLASEAGAPILPVAITGTSDILAAQGAVVRRGASVRVSFGRAIESGGADTAATVVAVQTHLEANACAARAE